jgi:chromosomal replication initiator protein
LESGLVITLKEPDLDVRLRYTLRESSKMGIPLSKEHALTIAGNFYDFRTLSGIITKIYAFISQNKRTLTDMALDKVLSNSSDSSNTRLTPETVIQTVAEHFLVSPTDIIGNRRNHPVVQARQISILLCRELLGFSFPALGAVFGDKHHTTIFYAYKKMQTLQEGDSVMNNMISKLKKKCLNRRI